MSMNRRTFCRLLASVLAGMTGEVGLSMIAISQLSYRAIGTWMVSDLGYNDMSFPGTGHAGTGIRL
jgi:hypothetical protein